MSDLLKLLAAIAGVIVTIVLSVFAARDAAVKQNTKQDEKIKFLEKEVNQLKADMEKIASKEDLALLRTEVKENSESNSSAHGKLFDELRDMSKGVNYLIGVEKERRNKKG